MGYGSEIADEISIADLIYEDAERRRIYKGIWTMKDETRIRVSEMTTRHIHNCINMLNRSNSELAELWIYRFKEELENRGCSYES